MFGLLDQFNTDDPAKQARLAQSLALLQAGGPSRVPVSLFQGLGMAGQAGLEAKRQAQKDAQAKLLQDMQLQQFTAQREDAQRKQAQEAARSAAIERMNPMNAGPVPKPQMDAFTMFQSGMLPASEYLKTMQPKEPKYQVVDGRIVRMDTDTPQISLDVPQRPDFNKPFMPDGRPNPAYQAYAKDTAKAGASNVSVNTEKGFLGDLAQGMGKALSTERDNAQAAVSTINTVQRLKDALKSGSVITGPFASQRVKLAQLGTTMGIAGKDTEETLTKTRSAIQSLAQLELDAAQQMKGQGQITEAERSIIRRAASGDIDGMTTPELQTLANALEKTARGKIKGYQGRVAPLKTMPGAAPIAPFLDVQEPASDGGGKVVNFGDLK